MVLSQNNLAIRFEPNAYSTSGKELMGRQAAGRSFLQAVATYSDPTDSTLFAYTHNKQAYEAFRSTIVELNPKLSTNWARPFNHDLLSSAGTVYWPDPTLDVGANMRLRASPDAYSLCGVTHTTASKEAMDVIRNLSIAPVMPWDALICTSQAVKKTTETIFNAQNEFLAWRTGGQPKWHCQFPVIPLGIHTADFEFQAQERAAARQHLGAGEDDIIFLFIGRLNPFVKAHPLPMYAGLQQVFERTGKNITLIECGWHSTDDVKTMMADYCKAVAPNVRHINVDGRVARDKHFATAACDVFVSLSDNIQETFGLTPVEAMAAGKPVIVSDWNGYKELLEDGVQGFKIPTMMPDETTRFARNSEAGQKHGMYCASVALTTAVDIASFVDKAAVLAENKTVREEMGRKAQLHAKQFYDWSVVFPQYQQLWRELADIRSTAKQDEDLQKIIVSAPKASPGRLSPSDTFSTYPTTTITNESRFSKLPHRSFDEYLQFMNLELMNVGPQLMPHSDIAEQIFEFLDNDATHSVPDLANYLGESTEVTKRYVGFLLKTGFLQLDDTPGS